jgi:peptidoglycan/xylan/chitin deacetylase (PgdA/CDA1 family)
MPKLELLLSLMCVSGAMHASRALAGFGSPRLTVLAYHRVLSPGPEDEYPYDIELVSADPEQFDWQVRYLKSHYDVITFRDVIAHMDGKAPLPKRPVIITFDDGFSDNHEHAFPVLRSHGVPATFFISTGYIGQQHTFWFDRIAALMLRMPVGAMRIPEHPRALPSGDGMEERRRGAAEFLEVLKVLPEERRVEILREADERWGSLLDGPEKNLSRPLTWEQVDEMRRGGMEFGSHTQSHPVLSRIGAAQLASELSQSKIELESRLGLPVQTLSYPVGMGDAIDDRVKQAASAAGYRIACSYECGVNPVPRTDQFDLRRQHVERYVSREYFRMLLDAPWLQR